MCPDYSKLFPNSNLTSIFQIRMVKLGGEMVKFDRYTVNKIANQLSALSLSKLEKKGS